MHQPRINHPNLFFLSLILFWALPAFTQDVQKSQKAIFIEDLMSKMTLQEKIGQLNLPTSGEITTGEAKSSDIAQKIREGKVGGLLNVKSVKKIKEIQTIAVDESRLKIPLLFGMDVIHGYQTTFPIPLGLASSWDMNLIEKSARIAAQEASAEGINWTYSPMVDIARDPRWGRIAEGAGEDAYLGSRIAEAYVKGYQGDDLKKNNTILSCVKHFALYGAAEAGRDYNTTDMSLVRMYNEYLPPYKAAVDAGAGSIMTSFNDINGIPATGNRWLMTEVLRNQWNFKGFVVTDFTAINEMMAHGMGDLQQVSALALHAGTDMDMVGEAYLSTLEKSLAEQKITLAEIDLACRRILEAKYDLGLFDDPYKYCDETRSNNEVATPQNMKVAREIATQTFVLLKNDNQILPLAKKGKIALIGPLAHSRFDMAGMWSVAAEHKESVTVLEGFKNVLGPQAEILYAKGANVVDDKDYDAWITWGTSGIDSTKTSLQLRKEALKVAKKSDVIVAVLGEGAEMSGESSSRSNIDLPENQLLLLKELVKLGKPVVLVLYTGRPLTINWESKNVPAILNVWFGGTQGGNAVADVVFGDVNPSGKLPVTFPQSVGQIPLYYNHKNTGRPLDKEWFQKYRSNYLDVTNEPLFPFGYGLSYTNFKYSNLTLSDTKMKENEKITISVQIENTGNFDGKEVVQLYLRDLVGSISRPVLELKDFQKVEVKKGTKIQVEFEIDIDDLKFYNQDLQFVAEPGIFEVFVGTNSKELLKAEFEFIK
jgi:beta-glucosidase